ncbi:MAG: S1 RNA-binding domain-containing protein [Planctomycetia bacterium]|nr:S1 RNA-binding domain-containing protein [Planctomycetia bacterium]
MSTENISKDVQTATDSHSDVSQESHPMTAPVVSQTPDESSPTPLQTYDSMNADAPVVTPNIIQNRLAKLAAEAKAKSAEKHRKNAENQNTEIAEDNQNDALDKRSPKDRDRFSNQRTSRNPQKSRSPFEEDSEKGNSGKPFKKNDRFETSQKARFENYPREPISKVPVPNLRETLSDDLEQQFADLFQDKPLDELMGSNVDAIAGHDMFEDGAKVNCQIISIQRDTVFVELGTRDQGVIPLKQFPEETQPAVGQIIEAVVTRFNAEEGLYDVSLPLAAAEVGDWSSLSKGLIVEARIVKANKGGLECEVGKLRAFMPIGQIATFRVENAEQFIGERWKCIITEINPQRRNLVVSRRVLMEKEREELREKLLAELEVGQVRDGLVRKLIDVGAFVDLGGVDGFIPISAMSWGRISHPSIVMKEGDRIKVTVQKIDLEKNRISLSFKDESLDPWLTIFDHLQEKMETRGRVTNIMQFGAFVELMPGIEGLIHISELAYSRVNNVSDVLNVGEWVDVLILSIDQEKRKISLSIKQLRTDPRIEEQAKLEEEKKAAEIAEEQKQNAEIEAIRENIKKKQFKGQLQGGVKTFTEGDKFGLNW